MKALFKILLPLLLFTAIATSCQDAQAIKLKQYQAHGRALYLQHCSNCHQPEGQGLGDLYPPLAYADYMDKDLNRTICITKKGLSEEITVNGKIYSLPMPANKDLTPIEVAEIVTYITTEWGGRTTIVTSQQVEKAYATCD